MITINRTSTLVAADIKNIMRDRSLSFVLFVPILMIVLLRFAVPQLQQIYPPIIDFYPAIVAFSCMMIAIFPAYVMAFVMMDEKDQQVVQVIRVLPVSIKNFLLYRLLLVMGFSFFYVTITLILNSLIEFNFIQVFILAFLVALIAPMTMFFIVSFAKNKIEGVTMFKLLNMLLILPILQFFIDSPLLNLVGIIPVFWTYAAFTAEGFTFFNMAAISLLLHGGVVWLLMRRMVRSY